MPGAYVYRPPCSMPRWLSWSFRRSGCTFLDEAAMVRYSQASSAMVASAGMTQAKASAPVGAVFARFGPATIGESMTDLLPMAVIGPAWGSVRDVSANSRINPLGGRFGGHSDEAEPSRR